MDPYFQDWVAYPDKSTSEFWESFFETYPHKREVGEKARDFLRDLRFREDYPNEKQIERSLATHLQAIGRVEDSGIIPMRRRITMKRLAGIAALFGGVVLVTAALILFMNKESSVAYHTRYGETRPVTLPDGSAVMLNAHSTISYRGKWDKGKREVWLDGEAFFTVNRSGSQPGLAGGMQPFIVHTQHVNIEVLGTSFDVRLRRGKSSIVLETGKIKVSFKDDRRNDIVMRPGEMLDYDPQSNQLTTATTNPEKFSAWRENKLLLDNPSVREIIRQLEDHFGKPIVLEDAELGDRKIEGAILLNDMDDALFVLSNVLNAQIVKKEDTIIIRRR